MCFGVVKCNVGGAAKQTICSSRAPLPLQPTALAPPLRCADVLHTVGCGWGRAPGQSQGAQFFT